MRIKQIVIEQAKNQSNPRNTENILNFELSFRFHCNDLRSIFYESNGFWILLKDLCLLNPKFHYLIPCKVRN